MACAESSSSSSIQSIDQAPIDTSTLSETCRNYLLVRDSVLKDLQVVQQQEASRKRDRSLDLSIEEISPPSKRPVKERLGTRQDDSSQVLQGSSNQPEVNLSTKFTIQNDSLKETDNSVVNVSSTSSSTGVASDSSEAPPSSPAKYQRPSPVNTRSLTACQSTPVRRTLLPSFQKHRPRTS